MTERRDGGTVLLLLVGALLLTFGTNPWVWYWELFKMAYGLGAGWVIAKWLLEFLFGAPW